MRITRSLADRNLSHSQDLARHRRYFFRLHRKGRLNGGALGTVPLVRQPVPSDDWPPSWRHAYQTDCAEFWGSRVNVGYTYAYQRRFAVTIQLVEQYLPAGSDIVDLAAAQGNFTLALAESGYRVTWNDLRGELQGYVEAKRVSGDVRYLAGNAFELDDVGPFDAVLATEIIEHVAHPDDFLSHVHDLCRPGGYIFLSTPHGGYMRNKLPNFRDVEDLQALEAKQFKPGADGHLFLFTNDELVELAGEAGLSVVRILNFTSPVLGGDLGRLVKGLRYVPAGALRATNAVLERLPRRFLTHTVIVLQRRPIGAAAAVRNSQLPSHSGPRPVLS